MLITTSRKPSQRTRSFCKSLNRVFKSEYTNRGKMSIRDVLLKSSEIGFNKTAVISETKGNPSKIEFYNEKGDILISLDVTVSVPTSRGGRVKKDDLSFRCEVDDLDNLAENLVEIFDIPECKDQLKQENILLLKYGGNEKKAALEFYDTKGASIGPKIYIKNWKL